MISATLKVKQTEAFNYVVEYSPEFESLSARQKLDLLTDAIIELNTKWKEVDENY
jgi:hypothetical protein